MEFVDPLVTKSLMSAIEQLRAVSPDVSDILDKAKSGEMSEEVVMRNLMETITSDGALSEKFQEIMMTAMAPLRQASITTPDSSTDRPLINPLVHAAIIERVQFDGDIPELRFGGKQPGVAPAVPVKTMARNPVAIGAMLNRASDKVAKELKNQMGERRRLIEESMAADPNALTIIRSHGELMSVAPNDASTVLAGTRDSDPEGYRRGEKPHAIVVTKPSGSVLATMSDTQKHELAWKFVSTTQGRNSAISTITSIIVDALSKRGLMVKEREFDPRSPKVEPLAYAEWTVNLTGQGATQPAFAMVDISARVLANRLFANMGVARPEKCFLEVESLNSISDREVGWAARIIPGQ